MSLSSVSCKSHNQCGEGGVLEAVGGVGGKGDFHQLWVAWM